MMGKVRGGVVRMLTGRDPHDVLTTITAQAPLLPLSLPLSLDFSALLP